MKLQVRASEILAGDRSSKTMNGPVAMQAERKWGQSTTMCSGSVMEGR